MRAFCTTSNTLYALHPIYSKLHRKSMPTNGRGEPLQVHVGFYVESLGNFRSTEMTFDMDLYLYMSWQDTHMRHNGSDYVLVNDKALLDQMWLPDLYFANARTAYFHEVTVHNFNMFVSPEGVIAYGTRPAISTSKIIHWIGNPARLRLSVMDHGLWNLEKSPQEFADEALSDWLYDPLRSLISPHLEYHETTNVVEKSVGEYRIRAASKSYHGTMELLELLHNK
ncbi:hypothetical protein NECAME_05883 [Necator americanus]|uniref:Neurotransmitter-gated ion-channel ligand-binding domain-containing protein n=1 Tax=Necator americanus TaxID=51031 RepID=W2TY22_NECAM|nr:hypothetical protein NECAME_05883 [Necator americanus]ETN86579.1 hypothetical protein NECAME_05883 [Necator americanus]